MSKQTQANDWKVSGVAQIGGAAVVGGGVFFFQFLSEQASVKESFIFSAFGLGAGGSAGGVSLRPDQPTAIRSDQSFSINDLDSSLGRITSATASLSVGYSLVYISAFNFSGSLFSSQSVSGGSAGVGLGAFTMAGMWTLV